MGEAVIGDLGGGKAWCPARRAGSFALPRLAGQIASDFELSGWSRACPMPPHPPVTRAARRERRMLPRHTAQS